MDAPLVSVIVPNYNHAPYLRQRIDSILAQTEQRFELVLLDDASTDDSLALLTSYAGLPRVQLVVNTENGGSPFAQWNKGVTLARGAYIWIAESDDAAHPDLLATNLKALEENPSAVMAYCQTLLMDEAGAVTGSFLKNQQFVFQTTFFDRSFVADGRDMVHRFMARHNMVPNASAALIRKDAWLAVGGPPLDWKLNGDWLFYARLFLQGQVVFSARELNYFRVHPHTQRQRANANGRVYEELLQLTDFMEACGTPEGTVRAARREYATWWAWSLWRQDWNAGFFAENFNLFRKFRKYKPALLLEVVRTGVLTFAKRVLRIFGLHGLAKRWRARMFPGKYFEG